MRKMMLGLALVAIYATQSLAAEKVTFALNWIPYGLHYGVFAAESLGYYKQAGLDVDIQRGYGSGDTVKRVGVGSADIGMADMASVAVGRTNDFAVKGLAVVLDRSVDAVFYVKGSGIEGPATLPGHKLGATVGETALNLLPVLAANAGFDAKKVDVVNLAAPAKYPSLITKKVDAIVGFTTEEPGIMAAAKKAGVEVGRILYSDYGIDYYSITLIASDSMIAQRHDVLKKVVNATMRGYAWAIKNPDKAADLFTKRFPVSSRDLTLAQWKVAISSMVTERTRAHGLGYIDPDKMKQTLTLLQKYQGIKSSVKPSDIYDGALLEKVEVK
jgi:NitT/TauT family transport system substrate-binding protein